MSESMDSTTKKRLKDIMFRSWTGKYTSDEENDFCAACFKKWPEEYKALRKEISPDVKRSVNPWL